MGPALRPHVDLVVVNATGTEYRTRATREPSTVTTPESVTSHILLSGGNATVKTSHGRLGISFVDEIKAIWDDLTYAISLLLTFLLNHRRKLYKIFQRLLCECCRGF